MERKYRIQLRTEIYGTYILHMKNLSKIDDDEMMDAVIDKLDKELKKNQPGEDFYLEDSFTEFGGFMSIEEEKYPGNYTQLLGQKHAWS